ncbi:acylphosphatase [Candidatus Beckwithbacteria bacterium]|nr:acylphosphatase [Candidatus Beckwithbacteria bacterium]
MKNKKHLRIIIQGRVQGIGFRFSAVSYAKKLGLAGTVCNQNDGSVLIEVEGDQDSLETFVAWCHQGPRLAKIKQVEVFENKIQNYSDFEIINCNS